MTPREGVTTGDYMLVVLPAISQFALGRQDPGRIVDLVAAQPSEAIRRGNAPNRLELTCAGSTIIASINGVEVASVQDRTYTSGHVTVMVGRSGALSVEARFDHLVVREALVGSTPPAAPVRPRPAGPVAARSRRCNSLTAIPGGGRL